MLKGFASASQAIFDWIHFHTLIGNVLSCQYGYIARSYLEMSQEGFDVVFLIIWERRELKWLVWAYTLFYKKIVCKKVVLMAKTLGKF